MVSHCNTAAHAARLLALQCGAADPENNLKALALKHHANKAFERGDHVEAEQLYSEVCMYVWMYVAYIPQSKGGLSQGLINTDSMGAPKFRPE